MKLGKVIDRLRRLEKKLGGDVEVEVKCFAFCTPESLGKTSFSYVPCSGKLVLQSRRYVQYVNTP